MRRFHFAVDPAGRAHFEEGRILRGRRHRHEVKEGHRGGGRGRRGGHGGRGGAQTFRRGRAVEFYKSLESKEQTLIAQLETKEFQSINQLIAAELKAVQAIKAEFKLTFGILEEELSNNGSAENEEISDK